MGVSPKRVARVFLADLNPPLGYPGGSCHLQGRIDKEVRNDSLVQSLIEKHFEGDKYSPQEEGQIYDDMIEEGPIKGTFFKSVKISSHAQYRMDIRSINLGMLKAALREFYDSYIKMYGKVGLENHYTRLLRGRDIRWMSPRPRLEIFFTVLRFQEPSKQPKRKAEVDIRIDTVFVPGESPLDPVPPGECSNWEGWSGDYEQGFERLFPKVADAVPPLGYPGGPCYTMQRIHENVKNPKLVEDLVDKIEEGKSLSNPEASKVYGGPEVEKGPHKMMESIVVSSHAQYRMDQRGVTVTEVRLALAGFVKAFYDGKSKKSPEFRQWSEDMAWGEPIKWTSKVPNGLTVVFQIRNKAAHVITTYWKGEQDPRPVSEESCGYPSAGRVARLFSDLKDVG